MESYPPVVVAALRSMDETQKLAFETEYRRRARSKWAMRAFAVLFPIQLFLLGKPGLGFLYWITLGGLGVWTIVEWFLTDKRVRIYNGELATDIARDLKIMA